MHPLIRQQLAADRNKEMIAKAGDWRRARQARRAGGVRARRARRAGGVRAPDGGRRVRPDGATGCRGSDRCAACDAGR